ncbi:MAG: Alpha/beta hydrolase fold protein [Candidatus Moranbacteria bacterium GW2011_GWC2_37_8]|nr:MAG: Alpha/beta hydrolase fold protein [Candidatus Moranbacteria bacterium GW2011_GWC2_37_8]KKQ62430.1 MAG: Alpha/beta hydrolase fold protein [Parcubacteria group bacterium GW2011_GWC1_38_22]KKQ80288.1 MAG: Alpha/beta hydrolase fold protein [Candidatus Moranbacteria bacterium GW2011_GWD2_38_7]
MAKTALVIIESREKQVIKNVIGPQLKQSKKVEVSTSRGATLAIDYCIINDGNQHFSNEVFLMVTGFGSGWTGTAKFGYDLAILGHEVCMVSMPGYGNSDDPFLPYYVIDNTRRDDADILANFIKQVLPGKKVHLVGHSMGAEIITNLASRYPKLVTSMILLAPAGFEKRGLLEVGIKFVANGILHGIAFRGNKVWAELKNFLPKEKSPFALSRLRQRIREWIRLCHGNESLEAFKDVPKEIPIICMWAAKDFVFQKEKSSLFKIKTAMQRSFSIVSLPLWHNVTMEGSEKTAHAVDSFVRYQVN